MAKEFLSEAHVITVDDNNINIKAYGRLFRPVRDSLTIPLRTITNVYINTPFSIIRCEATVSFNTIDGQTHTFNGMSNPQARSLHKLLTA